MRRVIITLGREFGSGGREIGKKLAERLEIPFFDKEIIRKAAEDSGIVESVMDYYDEHRSSPIFSSGSILYDIYQMPMSDRVYLEQCKAIKDIASKGGCVIVGRCADMVLENNPALLRVFICANMKDKVERKRAVEPNKTDQQLEAHIRGVDKKRAKYYSYYTDKKWGEARQYDLCLNSSLLGIDETVNLIIEAAEKLEAKLNK
ncbi:MAG: cytidylate kinase-like family protein [Oscillospiraceae bacterium]|nr:cytidylate kinase-like family protein [Oscillospiraceae bacterium]